MCPFFFFGSGSGNNRLSFFLVQKFLGLLKKGNQEDEEEEVELEFEEQGGDGENIEFEGVDEEGSDEDDDGDEEQEGYGYSSAFKQPTDDGQQQS